MFLYNALQCSEILFSFVRLKVIDFFEVCGIDVMKCMLSSLDLAILSKDGKHFFAKPCAVFQVPPLPTSSYKGETQTEIKFGGNTFCYESKEALPP